MLVFTFKRKSKVVNNFVQNFSCGLLLGIYFPTKLILKKNLRNLAVANVSCILDVKIFYSNSIKIRL